MSRVGESEDPGFEEISDEPDFEASLESLESLVVRLEEGDLSLEESLRAFEEGVRLARICSGRLRSAELRITQLEQEVAGTGDPEFEMAEPEPEVEE
ncbi:MAG: exodeoxyribonuclease VII small subunit [Myxococcota bacterium]|nr:exodeoxyribonuclease VII small subunit [Myxococcota bacterium]